MIKYIFALALSVLLSSCSTYKTINEPSAANTIKPEPVTPTEETTTDQYHIDLIKEFSYDKEISKVNEINKISTEANNKTSQQQLMDSLFFNKNRKPSNIKTSFLKIVREKRRTLRKKLSDKRKLFFKEQRERRKKYSKDARLKKDEFRKGSPSSVQKKEFYKNLDLERKHFFATEKDEKKLFDSHIKSLEKEIDARFKDLNKEFEDNLKVYKSSYGSS